MILGISSYTYPWTIGVPGHPSPVAFTHDDLLAKARQLGVHLLQICDNLPLDRLSADERASFAARALAAGVQIEVGTRGSAPAHLMEYIQIARQMGSPILRIVLDSPGDYPSVDEVVQQLCEAMPTCESCGITLAVENHDRFTSREFVEIMERVGSSSLGICLDTVNSFGALEGPEVVVGRLAPWTVNLHVKDFTIFRASHNLGFTIEGRPAGEGMLNVPWVLDQLRQHGRDVNAILELWTPPEAEMAATIRKEDEWARQSVAYLRKYFTE